MSSTTEQEKKKSCCDVCDKASSDISFQGDQDKAYMELVLFLYGSKQKFLLIGSAGVGKTFLLCLFISRFIELFNFVLVAPTNKAISVLKEKVYDMKIKKQI